MHTNEEREVLDGILGYSLGYVAEKYIRPTYWLLKTMLHLSLLLHTLRRRARALLHIFSLWDSG